MEPIDEPSGQQNRTDKIEVSPKWYLSGHTMTWILFNAFLGWIVVWGFGLTLIPIVLAFHHRNRTRYTLTGGRLHVVEGGGILSSEETKQIPVRDITDLSTSASFMERKFGVGTVKFTEGDGAYSKVKLESIPGHKNFSAEIGKRQNQEAKTTRYQA